MMLHELTFPIPEYGKSIIESRLRIDIDELLNREGACKLRWTNSSETGFQEELGLDNDQNGSKHLVYSRKNEQTQTVEVFKIFERDGQLRAVYAHDNSLEYPDPSGLLSECMDLPAEVGDIELARYILNRTIKSETGSVEIVDKAAEPDDEELVAAFHRQLDRYDQSGRLPWRAIGRLGLHAEDQ